MTTLRNSVHLIGNLGNDPEVRHFDSGRTMVKVRIATNERYAQANGERKNDTQWHTLVAWGKTAEYIERNLRTGHKIAVEGKLTYRKYEAANGEKKHFTEIVINEVVNLTYQKKQAA